MKNKKPLIALIVLLLIGVVGVTFAYFTTDETIENVFKIGGSYSSDLQETFKQENDWLPGEEVEKIVKVQNTGQVGMVVRIKYTEVWEAAEAGVTLDGNLSGTGTPRAVQINFDNTSDWVKQGEWYYYKNVLEPNDITTAFIKSVELNSALDLTADAKYLNATYKLNINAQTIQADGARTEWGIDNNVVTDLPAAA